MRRPGDRAATGRAVNAGDVRRESKVKRPPSKISYCPLCGEMLSSPSSNYTCPKQAGAWIIS